MSRSFSPLKIMPLALIFVCRMLGLFMILPIFSVYAHHLSAATPTLIGIGLGIYGLTQGCLQIPFGMLSDKLGRKTIIALGLGFFILGSVVAALATSIWGVIIGRALQGAGAIGSTLMATVADITPEEQRTQAMAIIGLTIGLSFSLAMLLGPLLNTWLQVSGIFWLTGVLGLFGLLILYTQVPPIPQRFHRDVQAIPHLFKQVLTNRELLRLDIGIFIQHAILTALFVVLPLLLSQQINLPISQQWKLYLPILVLSFIAMVPLILIAEKKRHMKPIFLLAIALCGIGQLLLWQSHHNLFEIGLYLFIYFLGFNLLEATLPSLVSKIAPVSAKGTAMGIYSSAQFLGIFFGGTIGGWLYGNHHVAGVFYASTILALTWFIIASMMQKPHHFSTKIIALNTVEAHQVSDLTTQLLALQGVKEVAISLSEKVAYLKVDHRNFNKNVLDNFKLGESHG